ncbi:hypothetical protein [Vreelandella massiliensis]|uniref:hypothetical protein n=1 Tax=Vreelandella massiliensis TaxID=1816686 RepID=UPI0011819E07|nr:hypothetical protein [Halomonas massiliensis]
MSSTARACGKGFTSASPWAGCPVEGRYVAGVPAWETENALAQQKQRLTKILKEWAAFQAKFFAEASIRSTTAPAPANGDVAPAARNPLLERVH